MRKIKPLLVSSLFFYLSILLVFANEEFPKDREYPCWEDIWLLEDVYIAGLEKVTETDLLDEMDPKIKQVYKKLVKKCIDFSDKQDYERANEVVRKQIYPFFLSLRGENEILWKLFTWSSEAFHRGPFANDRKNTKEGDNDSKYKTTLKSSKNKV